MRIGKRNFPYPVLNAYVEYSDYAESESFQFCFDTDGDGGLMVDNGDLLLKNAHFELGNTLLEGYAKAGSILGIVVIECPRSFYRETFNVTCVPSDIRIPQPDLYGKVDISCYLYAAAAIPCFMSGSFLPEYAGLRFDIEKGDILAVDERFSFTVNVNDEEDNRIASIFTIVKLESEAKRIAYQSNERGITIMLPSEYYACYDNMKMYEQFNNISFAMLAIPVLASCLLEIQKEHPEDIDDLVDEKRWFNAVRLAYAREKGEDLDLEAFMAANALDLAQTVLNDATCKGLTDFNELLLGSMQVGTEEEESAHGED